MLFRQKKNLSILMEKEQITLDGSMGQYHGSSLILAARVHAPDSASQQSGLQYPQYKKGTYRKNDK
jgi:hypothetical protein